MLLLVTTVQIYAEQYAQEDGAVLATAIDGLRAGHRQSNEDSE
jgi:hypothetical protein